MQMDLNDKIKIELINKIEKEYPRIIERRINLISTGVSPRVYHHWKSANLIDEERNQGEKRSWNKLNIYEFVWIKILKFCRSFGVPISDLVKLKEMAEENYIQFLYDDIEDYLNYYKRAFNVDENQIKKQRENLEHLKFYSTTVENDEKHLISLLGISINKSLFNSTNCALYILQNEKLEFCFVCDDELQVLEKDKSLDVPHIIIPIKPILEEFMEEPLNEDSMLYWGLINRNENKVLEALRNNNFTEITIKKTQGNEQLKIFGTLESDVKDSKAKEIRKILGMNTYDEINIKYRNDKHLVIKNKQQL